MRNLLSTSVFLARFIRPAPRAIPLTNTFENGQKNKATSHTKSHDLRASLREAKITGVGKFKCVKPEVQSGVSIDIILRLHSWITEHKSFC